jgi:hypothetical protein
LKELFGERLVRALFVVTGLITTVGGPIPTTAPKLQAFSSNGCSVFPDGDTFGCCYVHDMAYWAGGTGADRRKADRALEQCVADVSNHVVGGIIYAAVTIFGTPGVPTRVQWGYGWDDTRQIGYAALTPVEREQVDTRKQDACKTLALDADTGRYMIDTTHWLRDVDVRQICPTLPVPPARR